MRRTILLPVSKDPRDSRVSIVPTRLAQLPAHR